MAADEDDFWWCADETGELHTLSGDELRECLADRTIPAHALVWRQGWATWAPASRVPSFQKVLSRRDVEHQPLPARTATPSAPPPAPLGYYAERRASRRASLAPLQLDLSDIPGATPPRAPEEPTPPPPSERRFPVEEAPTVQAPMHTLPEEAFPEREDFLAHLRARRARKSAPSIPDG